METRSRSRSRSPARQNMDNDNMVNEIGSNEPGQEVLDESIAGTSGEAVGGGGRPPKRMAHGSMEVAPPKAPRHDILLAPLPKSLLAIWGRKHPRAAVQYSQLQGNKDLVPELMDSWIRKHSDAYALYTKLLSLDVTSDEEEEGGMLDDSVSLQVDPTQDHFHEDHDQDKAAAATHQKVAAAAGSSRSGENVPPMDKRTLNVPRIHQELSDINTENLTGSVTERPGELNPHNWLNNVHGLSANDGHKSVSIQLPSGSVVNPSDEIEGNNAEISLLDLGLTEHLSEDMINQIQSGKFVELHKLLPVETAELNDDKKVVTFDEEEGSVVVKPKDMRKKNYYFFAMVKGMVHIPYGVY